MSGGLACVVGRGDCIKCGLWGGGGGIAFYVACGGCGGTSGGGGAVTYGGAGAHCGGGAGWLLLAATWLRTLISARRNPISRRSSVTSYLTACDWALFAICMFFTTFVIVRMLASYSLSMTLALLACTTYGLFTTFLVVM